MGLVALSAGASQFVSSSVNGRSGGSIIPPLVPAWRTSAPPAPVKTLGGSFQVTPIGPIGGPAIYRPGGGVPFLDDHAINIPSLPPGTRQEVIDAVNQKFAEGTLTNREAEAVSRPSAPLYFPDDGNTIEYEVRDEAGNVVSTEATVVDFGSPEAAAAALADYYNNFV